MTTKFSEDIEAFRQEVRDFIQTNLPEHIRRQVAQGHVHLSREDQLQWQRILYDQGGWGCPSWPKEHGGPGWSDEQQYVFERELALNDAPRLMTNGVGMLGPTIMMFGTSEQQEKYLPGIAKGELIWAQGFSEPNAGSDLAALGCRAVKYGDEYVINGSKMWTTEAHISEWMFGIFRTDNTGRKQQGITFLLVDMNTHGISVAPIITYDFAHEVSQVFFDNVRVPAANMIGEENDGWTVAKYLLSQERFGTAEVSRSMASLVKLKQLVARQAPGHRSLIEDPVFLGKLAEVEIDLMAVELTERRFLFSKHDDSDGSQAPILKIRGTEIQQKVLELIVEAIGYYAHILPQSEESNDALVSRFGFGDPVSNYLNFRKSTIFAGASEILRNILSKTVLGL